MYSGLEQAVRSYSAVTLVVDMFCNFFLVVESVLWVADRGTNSACRGSLGIWIALFLSSAHSWGRIIIRGQLDELHQVSHIMFHALAF